jgi:hypothetical protein
MFGKFLMLVSTAMCLVSIAPLAALVPITLLSVMFVVDACDDASNDE